MGSEALWLRSPDMQGPLNTAGLIMNQEDLFVAMLEQPAKVHAFLEHVTEFLINYARYLREGTGGRICGNIWPYTFFPASLGLSFTEDLMPLTSARTYRTFALPCLRRLEQAFGGLHIHCCGPYGHHVPTLAASGLNIRALEYHYPATTLEELAPLAERTVFVPYIILHKQDCFASVSEYYRYLLETSGPQFRFWFACQTDDVDMLEFAREYA